MLLAVIYLVLVLTAPISKLILDYYHLRIVSLRFLELTYVLPQIAIWSAAYFGFYLISKYAATIARDKDGKAMNKIAIGIGIYAFASPLNNILSTLLSHVTLTHIHFQPTATIINNYDSVLISLIAFLFIGAGARGLADTVKSYLSYRTLQGLALVMTAIGSVFCYLIFNPLPGPLRLGLADKPHYYLPSWLLIFTIVVPYIFIWVLGALAALDMRGYYLKVKGVIYKSSIKFLALGFAFIIFSLIVLQYFTTVSSKLASLRLLPLLLIIYPLIIIESIGYILVAIGAKKLKKIEES
jgi:hypothetical protein